MGTETIIDKVLEFLELNPWEDLGNWPADAVEFGGMTLSESKMKNAVILAEPRRISIGKAPVSYSLFSTKTGWHSTSKVWRKSDI
jgi:hypothetical protein